MSESKRKIFFAILAVLLLLSGCIILLYPSLNGLWVDYPMRRNAEAFRSYVVLSQGVPEQEASHVVNPQPEPMQPQSQLPSEHPQLWLDMKAYNEDIFREGQESLSNPTAYEKSSFRLSDYGLETEVFGVLSIPRLSLEMPIYLGASKQNMANGATVMGQTSLPIGGSNTNCVLAGHRGWNGAAYFLYINQLEPGDTVTVTNLWETLTYEVVETRAISPNDVDAIHIQPNRE